MTIPRQGRKYTIKAGDTLQSISKAAYGSADKWRMLARAHGRQTLSSIEIYPGQVIFIPHDPEIRKIRNVQRK